MGPVRRLLAGVALVGLLAACSAAPVGSNGSSTSGSSTDKGYTSADGTTKVWAIGSRTGPVQLSGTDAAGAKQDVAGWRGDVVVVNTWYAACPPCRAEAPDLVALANADQAKGVHVIGVNSTDAAGTATAFARQFDVPYPSIIDTDGSAVAALQGIVPVNATPTTLILDREGRVAARILGRLDPSTLNSIVDQLLAEGSSASPSAAAAGRAAPAMGVAAAGPVAAAAGTATTAIGAAGAGAVSR